METVHDRVEEMDWDEELFEGEEQGQDEGSQVAEGERVVFTSVSDPTIEGLHRQFRRGTLVVQPDFQRGYVWDDARASRLIESVLLEIPLPVIYLAEEDGTNRRLVIDGQQRLTTFFRFYDGTLELRGLESRGDLNGKRFRDLSENEQEQFLGFEIRTVIILKQSRSSIKFEMFHRINRGSVALNDQELRNCIYRGRYNKLLRELSQDENFRSWFGESSLKRMRDTELVLRFGAFLHTHYSQYSSMRQFLNDEMARHQSIDERAASAFREKFRKSVRLCRSLLGEQGFRRFNPGDRENRNGSWSRKPSVALYDVLMYGFTQCDSSQIYPHLDSLREGLLWLMTSDQDFIRATDNTTGSRAAVRTRFEKWIGLLDDVTGRSAVEPRLFSAELKEHLYRLNPTCQLCGSRVIEIDDAAIDHIEEFWRGGRTIPENARLAHRYCNSARREIAAGVSGHGGEIEGEGA